MPDFGLLDLYTLIETDYPGTPYATEAATLRRALEAHLAPEGAEPVPAEGDPALPDLAADTTDTPDAAGLPHVLGDDMRPGSALPADVVEAAPPGTFGLSGTAPLNAEFGGYSWRVAALPSPLAAAALLRNFARREIRAGVVRENGAGGEPLYVVLLGQFASTDEAIAARADLPSTGVGRDLRVVNIYGLDLLTDQELDPTLE